MKRKTIRIIKKLIEILLCLAFVIAMIICFIKFVNAEDVYDKVEYGFWVIILLILTLRE